MASLDQKPGAYEPDTTIREIMERELAGGPLIPASVEKAEKGEQDESDKAPMDARALGRSGTRRPETSGTDLLAPARRALAPIERLEADYHAASARLAEVEKSELAGVWRLRLATYRGVLLLAGAGVGLATYHVLANADVGIFGALAALGIGANIMGLAHLAGGWGRRVQGAWSVWRKLAATLLAAGALAEILALAYVIWLAGGGSWGWAAALLGGSVVVAAVASFLRHHPSPRIERLLEDQSEAKERLVAGKARLAATLEEARTTFERETQLIEQAGGLDGTLASSQEWCKSGKRNRKSWQPRT